MGGEGLKRGPDFNRAGPKSLGRIEPLWRLQPTEPMGYKPFISSTLTYFQFYSVPFLRTNILPLTSKIDCLSKYNQLRIEPWYLFKKLIYIFHPSTTNHL